LEKIRIKKKRKIKNNNKNSHMKKKLFFLVAILSISLSINAQGYPVPEYSNEIYLVKKDTAITLMRLEKVYSNQEMKVKMMGMGGMDQGYSTDGEKSTIRLTNGSNLLFIFYTGEPASASLSPEADSAMKANGMNMSSMPSMSSMIDPSQMISLYNMKSGKEKRKILTQSSGLMGKSKNTATKFALSIKKVKDNYFEIKVDKSLSKGEYAFVMMDMGGMGQSYTLFAFAID
jgi:hypothetical protein